MKRTITTALATTLAAGTAAGAATVVVVPAEPADIALKREIVDYVQNEYGETAVYEDADELPDGVNADIVPGRTLPESAMEALPEDMAEVPRLAEESRWVRAGNHLVEVRPDRTIVMAVYDVFR